MTGPLLHADDLQIHFGGLVVLRGVNFTLASGELCCIIGPNGAGKSTLFNILAGTLRPARGAIRFEGQNLIGLAIYRFARLGILRKFQVPSLFENLTVRDNLEVAGRGLEALDRAARIGEFLNMLGLVELAGAMAGQLAHGHKQWLEIGMTLMVGPKLLLLDEPTAGMTAEETRATADLLLGLRGRIAIVVIEHDMRFVRAVDFAHHGASPGKDHCGRPFCRNRAQCHGARHLSGSTVMLRVRELRAGYGSTLILSGLSLELRPGEVLAILGRNGAGKTTLMRTIIGLVRPRTGSIDFDGASIVGMPPHRVAQKGVAFVPQGRGIFGKLSVRENLLIGTRAARHTAGQIPASIFDYFPILTERLEQSGATLSGGEQQMLAIARALCGRPRVLLLDEPSEGIQPSIVHDLGRLLRWIVKDESVAVLLVEQNLDLALQLADRALIMEKGRIVREARAAEFRDEKILNLQEFLAI